METVNTKKSSEPANTGEMNNILSGILDSIPDIIFYKNLEGVYLGCNAAFARFVGMNCSGIIGSSDYDLFDRKLADFFRENDQLMLEQGETRHNAEWIDYPDGRRVLVDTVKSPLKDAEGRIIGIIGISRDITDRKKAEDEWRQNNLVLDQAMIKANQMAEQSESASMAKDMFLAHMSHEIRTPLNGVIGMTRLMLNTSLTDKQRRYAEVAKTSAESLLAIVNGILDFSKIGAGKLDIEHIRFSIDDVINGALNSFSDSAAKKDIQIHAAIDPSIPNWLMGDPMRLSQILNNLMSNAIKFTDAGHIHLSVDIRYLDSRSVAINFAVRDSGIGIIEEHLSHIFDAFGQADKSTTRVFGGTGLGLTICKQLCEMMGGRIRVESTFGKGCVFSFVLPFELAKNVGASLLTEPELDGKKVLIADDNLATRHILFKLLSARSCQVQCAASGQEALEMLQTEAATRTPFELCLLDYRMPSMNGIETAHHIQRDKLLALPPMLLMADSRDQCEIKELVASAGILGFITKPVRPSTLLVEIQSALNGGACDRGKKPAIPEEQFSDVCALTVEDHEINREVIIELLKNIGIETEIAFNGLEAVERVRSRDYDVVFMDIHMPVMDGYAATRAIRSLNKPGVDNLPILAMTALAMKDDRHKFVRAGMNGHITKPIDNSELIGLLRRWLPQKIRRNMLGVAAERVENPGSRHRAPFPQIPGIDVTAGLQHLNGNHALYRRLLIKFAQDDAYALTREQLLDDLKSAHRKIHSIRSIAANLGGTMLASAASELEKALRDGRESEELLQEFVERNTALRAAINGAISLPQNDTIPVSLKSLGTEDELQRLLSRLNGPVTKNEPRACQEILKLFQEKNWPVETRNAIAELNLLISKYRFEEAKKTIKSLLESIDKKTVR